MRFYFLASTAIILNLVLGQVTCTEKSQPPLYTWKNVQIVGGGFVDGIIFHPTKEGLRYCRTDMGGAYRWDSTAQRWKPLLDWISYEDNNLMGVESIAIDPSNPDKLYLACGTYTRLNGPNAILISDNRGETFKRINVPFKMGGNENGRGNGERLSVDPKNGKILYMGTRLDGLWKSADGGTTWKKVSGFPDVSENYLAETGTGSNPSKKPKISGSGVVFVVFDGKSPSELGNASIVYAGCSLMGRESLYRSADGGETWQAIDGQPTNYRPNHAVIASDNMLYITYGSTPGPDEMTDGAVWKLNINTGEWTEITPDKPEKGREFGYAAVSVDAQNPQSVIVSTFNRYGGKGGENIFRSTNGGRTWQSAIVGNSTFDNSLAPFVSHTGIHWLFDIEIDPLNPNHAIFTTGYGGHETFNLTEADRGKPVKWTVMSTGIEETVALDLLSPVKGAHLISAIGDYGGFTHWNLDKPAPEGNFINPHFSNTDDIAYATASPNLIVRVGRQSNQLPGYTIGYSVDSGRTWQPTRALPTKNPSGGYISVSANGKNWIWTPSGENPYLTKDRGLTWQKVEGLPNNMRTISDPLNPDKFYGLSLLNGKLFRSSNGGSSFTEETFDLPGGLPKEMQRRGDARGGQDRIYATPGKEEDLWLAAFDGLYRISDLENPSFQKTDLVGEIHAFGFGKAAPGEAYPAMYLVGVVNNIRGIFRSDNAGKTWLRINDDQHQWGLILHITGDPKQYGRVYVGTHGRGIFYGDPGKR